ncbi:MAG: GmrSD restriction endonuclease domain-containing protein [Leptospirillum sp.]
MHAHDRFLPEWFNRIRSRQITLPRFQRFVAWGHSEVSGLLTTVLRGLPSGATLILAVGNEEKFKSRTMVDAPESGEKVTEQLLDGQQRLTALWRSLHDKYQDRTYLIGFENDPSNEDTKLPYVYGQARWIKNGNSYPMWINSPKECWSRGFIPIRLLRPEDIMSEIRQWVKEAMPEHYEKQDELFDEIIVLRDRVKAFNLPYLSLADSTSKEVALDVFIKMNTSSVHLSTYDIVVALVEEETGKSLHEHVDVLTEAIPRASEYADLPSLVLDVVALWQDRIPSQAGYRSIDYTKMIDEWSSLVKSIERMVRFLEEETIFDAQRLPSYTAIPIIAALCWHLPTQPDKLGNARNLLRKFLWRAFLTSRYEQSSTSNALQDYRGLRKVLCDGASENIVPILNEKSYSLPTKEMILQADWPRSKTIIGRGLLALQIKCGAEDLADGAKATVGNITSKEHPREYHHLFPSSTLQDAGISYERINRALNCALITWRTNRIISNKDPIAYLKERADNSNLGEEELRRRLRTHLIPYKQLSVGYDGMPDEERRARVQSDYEAFLAARAKILAKSARRACEGKTLELSELFDDEADA